MEKTKEMNTNATVIAKSKEKYDRIRKNRKALERQWMINLAFLYGKQYFKLVNSGESLADRIWYSLQKIKDSKKSRVISNKILVYYRSLLSRILKMKANVVVEPTTRMKRDVDSAKIGTEVMEDFWQNVNKSNSLLSQKYSGMEIVNDYLFAYILTYGKGYLNPYFNENAEVDMLVDGNIEQMPIGEVECRVVSPVNVVEDPLGRYQIETEIMSTEEVYNRYDVDIKADGSVSIPEMEKQLLSLFDKTDYTSLDDAVKVFKHYETKSREYPNGREFVYTDKEIIRDTELPEEYKGNLPLFGFTWMDLSMSTYFQGLVEQLIPLQVDYNTTISKLANFKKYAGKLMVPDGANLQQKWTDEDLQIVKYKAGREPKYYMPPNPPSFLFEDLQRIEADMQDIAMTHDPMLSKAPSGTSGIAIQSLQEKDDFSLSPITIKIEQKMSFFCETVLNIMAVRYQGERLLRISGADTMEEVKTFQGYEIDGNRRVKISLGSALPSSRVARQQQILELTEAGIIEPSDAKKHLNLGDLETAIEPIDQQTAKIENEEMAKGTLVEVQEWDDHKMHVDIVRDYMENVKFQELEEGIKAIFISHYKLHLELLGEELDQSGQVQGGQGMTPSGNPVQGG